MEGVGEALKAREINLADVEREELYTDRQEWRRIVHRGSIADRQ